MMGAESRTKNLVVTVVFLVCGSPGWVACVSAGLDNEMAGAAGGVGMAGIGGDADCGWFSAVRCVDCAVYSCGTGDAFAYASDGEAGGERALSVCAQSDA